MIPPGIEHFDVRAGEVRLHCAAMGPKDGPLVVLLHGFPECWVTWRAQLPALAAAGYRAVAPDMRGYGNSDKPRGVAAYRMEKLTGDVAALIAALGRDRADVVGHDWGGQVAWFLAMQHPLLVRRLALLNIPHPQQFARGLRTLRQLRKSWYMFFFQLPFLAERFMTDRRLRVIFKYTTERKGAYGDEEIAILVEAMRDRSGPVNYYRAAARYPQRLVPIEAPVLVIWGEKDRFLGAELAEPSPRWVPHARVERIPEASHWVQADAPERVNELLLAFLR
jgi:pimeloyl-ACP methyl ester carboxylesterase